jgi:TonB family protein
VSVISLMKLPALGLGVVLGFATVLTGRAELRLVCDLNGAKVTINRISINRVVGNDGTNIIDLPVEAPFRLEGELSQEMHLLHWGAVYYLLHPRGRDRLPAAQHPWIASVRLVKGDAWGGLSFDEFWPDHKSRDPALVIFGWVLNGKLVQTKVQICPPEEKVRLDQIFKLSEAEAMGSPVVLVWANGGFLPPRSWFKDARAEVALGHMMLGDIEPLRDALDRGLAVDESGRGGFRLFEFAAEAGCVEAIDLLLKRGAKVETFLELDTPLQRAVVRGRLSMVERLLAAGADPNRTLILELALRYHHHEVARVLLAGGAKISALGEDFGPALDGGFAEVARQCFERRPRKKFSESEGAALLMDHTERGHTAMVKLLLERKLDPNIFVGGRTPLLVATHSRDVQLVKTLLQGGAQVGLADAKGTTALMVACANGDLETARALIDAGADVNAGLKEGNTCLHSAAIHDSVELVELLLSQGANLTPLVSGKFKPLEMALLAGAGASARLLAAKGARCDLRRSEREALIEAAGKLDVVEVVRAALAEGWNANTLFRGRWSAFQLAEIYGARNVQAALTRVGLETPAVPPPTVVPVSELDAVPHVIASTPVQDTRESTERSFEQTVEMKLVIDEEGRVASSSVQTSPDGRLNFAASRAIQGWRFSVPTRRETRVCTVVTVPVIFKAAPDISTYVSVVDVAPVKITGWTPRLPRKAAAPGIQIVPGNVPENIRVQLVVNPDGHVKDITIQSPLDDRASMILMETLSDWIFTPGIRNGVIVPTRLEISRF